MTFINSHECKINIIIARGVIKIVKIGAFVWEGWSARLRVATAEKLNASRSSYVQFYGMFLIGSHLSTSEGRCFDCSERMT